MNNIEKEMEKVDKEIEKRNSWSGILTSFEGVVVGLIWIYFLGLIMWVYYNNWIGA